jgi:MFS family permease
LQWGTDAAGVYKVIAYTGLAKFLSVWICGELSDRIGRKIMVIIGALMYVGCFGGLLTTTSLAVAGVCAFLAGAATSFFDGSCYPAAQESYPKAPGSALILIKAFVSFSGLIYPMIVVGLRASGNWQVGVIIPLIASIVVLILAVLAPFSYDEQLKTKKLSNVGAEQKKKVVDVDIAKAKARFITEPSKVVAALCALYGGIAMMTMYSAQQLLTRFGLTFCQMSDVKAASLTSLYTGGSIIAVFLWATMMGKLGWRPLKVLMIDTYGAAIFYLILCVVRIDIVTQLSALAIGFFAAGGALQAGLSVMQEFVPGNKGRNLGIYYTFMGAASYLVPVIQAMLTENAGEAQGILNCLFLNFGVAVVGALTMTFLVFKYKTSFGVSALSKKTADE